MNRAIKVFKEVDTDGSGTIDILEFLNQTIAMKTEYIPLDENVKL